MINRRLIRVKVFKILFGRVNSESGSLSGAVNDLLTSCEKSLELYYFILSLPVAVKKVAEGKIEAGLKKYQPSAEEANPNMRFVQNALIAKLEENEELIKFCEKRGLNWNEHSSLVKKLYASMVASEYFGEYMNAEVSDFASDAALVSRFFEEELEDNDELHSILEDLSLFWTDDLEYVVNVITKKIGTLKQNSRLAHPALFLKEDDREYAIKLLENSLINYQNYVNLMATYIHNWEPERLAATDIALIVLGIAEAISFPDIPVKVTINEYVELSKFYSTPNSKVFVNGILDKIITGLTAEGKVEKRGRGLVGSSE